MSASEPVVDRIVALFAALDRDEVEALSPHRRATFADLCRHWGDVAGRRPRQQQRSGVLGDLRQGQRSE
jgi:hypothetical protein